MPLIRCPRCDEQERLRGTERDGRRIVRCGACGHEWERDLTPTCTACGSRDLEVVPTSTLEEAGRGEQRTPSGIRDVYRCWSCGAKDATSASAVADEGWLEARRTHVRRIGARRNPGVAPAQDALSHRVDSRFGMFEVGNVLGGRWRLARLFDWSSTDSLWLADDVDGRGSVLFKLLHPDETTDPARPQAYVASARAGRVVDHPNLLRVLDVRQRSTDVLIVLQAADERTVDDVLGTERDWRSIGSDVASALAAMHARGLAHLRVRPNKIWVPDGAPPRLADFGTGRARARLRARQSSDADLTWLAPEQLVSHDHAPPADVYSLALTLWVGLGGGLTDLGANPAEQATVRVDRDLPRLAGGTRASHPELCSVVEAAGRRDPSARPTAREFANLLGAT